MCEPVGIRDDRGTGASMIAVPAGSTDSTCGIRSVCTTTTLLPLSASRWPRSSVLPCQFAGTGTAPIAAPAEDHLDESDLVAHHERVEVPVPHTQCRECGGDPGRPAADLAVGPNLIAAPDDGLGRHRRSLPTGASRTMHRASTATSPSSVTSSGLTSRDSIHPWQAAARRPKPTRTCASCDRCQGCAPR